VFVVQSELPKSVGLISLAEARLPQLAILQVSWVVWDQAWLYRLTVGKAVASRSPADLKMKYSMIPDDAEWQT